MFSIQGIDHVALTVRDVAASVEWYQAILGLERRYEDAWGSFPAVVGIGSTSLALFPVRGDSPKEPPGADTLCFRHVAFRVDRHNFDLARTRLPLVGIQISLQDHGAAHSLYFVDPDGHQLEVTTYDVDAELD